MVLPSLRSFWMVLFSPPPLGVVRFVRLLCGWWSFSPIERQLDGANELNQVAAKQSDANESKVALLRSGGVFPPPSVWVAVFAPSHIFARWFFHTSSVWAAVLSYLSPFRVVLVVVFT